MPFVVGERWGLGVRGHVWGEEVGWQLHEEAEQIIVFEGSTAERAMLGSGIARSREEQMQNLARNAGRRMQVFMLQNPEWFNIDPNAARNAVAEVEALAEAAEEAEAVDAALEQAEDCVPTDDTPCPEVPAAN